MSAHSTAFTLLCMAGLTGASLLIPSQADAQEGFSQKAAAESLFREGAELLESGKTEQACSKFEASLQLDHALGTTLRLADCLDRAGKTASAWATFQEAASIAQVRGQQDRVEIALRRAADLESRLSRLRLVMTPTTRELPGLRVSLNGVVVPEGTWDSAVPVDPGLQRIEVEATGYEARTIEVRVRESNTQTEIEVPLLQPLPEVSAPPALSAATSPGTDDRTPPTTAPRPPTAAPITQNNPGHAHRVAAYISGAAGLAALGVGGYFTYRAYDLNQQSLGHCISGEPNSCSLRGKALRDDARSAGTVATIVSIAGGTAVAASVVLFIAAPRQEGSPSMQLSALASGEGAALQLEGSW